MAAATGFTFPGTFEVSAMGASGEGLEQLVPDTIEALGLTVHRDSLSTRASRAGNYVSVTIRFDAASREDYQAVYGALRALPEVRWTL
ncbi:MAG TPA: DUF493 family protein [Xanthomonadaceae bacterium]|nr:DUF493 family protein [Xanthomonadaceae bacterium]